MRHWMTFALALLVSFAVANDAEAKKPKKDKTATTETTEQTTEAAAEVELKPLEITATGIADVDNVFNQAADPLQTIRDARTTVDNLNKNLVTALGLTEGTALTDALNDLKTKAEGKIQVAVNEKGMPELKPSDAIPANVQAAIDGVNQSITQIGDLIPKLQALPAEFQQVAAAAAAINPASLTSSGVKATEAPKIMKTIKGNVDVLTRAPEEITGLISSIDGLKTSISATFGA